MKKRYIYSLILLLFILAAGFIVVKYKKGIKKTATTFYPVKERKGSSSTSEEYKKVKEKFDELMKMTGTNPDDTKSSISLASLYIQEARVTGDYMYYDMAAMRYVNEVLEKEIEVLEVEQKLQGRVKRQIEKVQKEYYLKEKLKLQIYFNGYTE